jgi:hypothetical protein
MANDELLVETEPDDRDAPRAALGPWAAMVFIVLAMLIWFGYQTVNLQREYGQLRSLHASQDAALEGVRKRQTQLETIARRVYALAQTGHPEATRIVQELARRGVTISPDAPAAAPAPPKSP